MKRVLLLLFVAVSTSSYSQNTTSSYLSSVMPNSGELWVDTVLYAFLDVMFDRYTKVFGSNPNSKLIVRDIGKIPSLATHVYCKHEVGGTGFVYDLNHPWAHGLKIVTKVGVYGLLTRYGISPEAAGELANYPGDTVGRFVIVAGEKNQKNITATWTDISIETFKKQTPNLPFMWLLGRLAKRYQVTEAIHMAARLLVGLDAMDARGYSERIHSRTPRLARYGIFTAMWTIGTAEKLFYALTFPPASRLAMDFGNWLGNWLTRDDE